MSSVDADFSLLDVEAQVPLAGAVHEGKETLVVLVCSSAPDEDVVDDALHSSEAFEVFRHGFLEYFGSGRNPKRQALEPVAAERRVECAER